MAKPTTFKSYLKARTDNTFLPFVIELEKGEFLEIPSMNTMSNEWKTAFSRYHLRMQEISGTKKTKNITDKQVSNVEDIYKLVNQKIEVFRHIDEKYGSTVWWMVFKDWGEFCAEQLKVSDQGK